MTSRAGFSLVEALVATALLVTVSGAVLALVVPGAAGAQARPEAVDMQQRARVAGDELRRDLTMAGAGVGAGPRTGALSRFIAPIVPRRAGLLQADAYDVARADAVTIRYAAATFSQASTSDLLTFSGALRLVPWPNCPMGRPVCGYAVGTDLLVFDPAGTFDAYTVTAVAGDTATLAAHRPDMASTYAAGAVVTPAETHVYWFDRANRQLRRYDGYRTDVPVADNVVGVAFEYYGDPRPPARPKPPAGTANCLYDAAGVAVPMATLPADGGSLAPLPLAIFTDGPWCGEGANRFDADLLRVRRVRARILVQAAHASLRATGPSYAVPGTARSAHRALPDLGIVVDVTPRNLNEGRR